MELLDIDSNRIDTIIKFKETLLFNDISPSHQEKLSLNARDVNEYGEIVVSKMRQSQKRLADAEIKQLINGYKEGKSTYALAEQFGCHRQTVCRILKRHNIKVTKCKGQRVINAAIVMSMYEEMHTTAEIAKKYNVSPQVILYCLREHGVKIRSRWDYEKISCY